MYALNVVCSVRDAAIGFVLPLCVKERCCSDVVPFSKSSNAQRLFACLLAACVLSCLLVCYPFIVFVICCASLPL